MPDLQHIVLRAFNPYATRTTRYPSSLMVLSPHAHSWGGRRHI